MATKLKKFLILNCTFVIILMMLLIPLVSFAQVIGNPPNPVTSNGKILNPLGDDGPKSISAFIHDMLIGAVKIGIPVVALAIIYCGFLFVFARGKPEELKKAKDALFYTLIGAALLLGAWAIANLIVDVIGNLD